MKYRIVKLSNGKIGVQEKWGFFYWYTNYLQHDTIEEAEAAIEQYKRWEKDREERKKLRVVRIIK